MSRDNFLLFCKHIGNVDKKVIADKISKRVKPIARDLFGSHGDSPTDILSGFFDDVFLATGASFHTRSPDGLNNLISNWQKGKSYTLILETYYYLHTIRRGQDLAEYVDRTIFSGESFFERHGVAVPGGFVAAGIPGPEHRNSVEIPATSELEDEQPVLSGIFPSLAPTRLYHGAGIRRADFSPCGKFIATSGKKENGIAYAFLWDRADLAPGYRPKVIARHEEDIYGCTFTQDAQKIITAAGHDAGVWSVRAHNTPWAKLKHDGDVSHMASSTDGRLIVTTDWEAVVYLWDARTFQAIAKERISLPHNHMVNCANFSPDSRQLIVGCSDGSVTIRDVDDLSKVVASLDGYNSEGVCSVSFSPDGTLAVVASYVGTTGLFDVVSRQLLRVFWKDHAHIDSVWSASFSHDQAMVVTASEDRQAIIWDVESGDIVARLPHPDALYIAYFSPDDRTVLTAFDDGRAYLWRVRE